jgi:polysaccharide biosynthesis protein PslJ
MTDTTARESGPRGRAGATTTSLATRPTELPGWPVLALLWGLPLWWVVGLFSLSTVVMALPMVLYLVARRDVLVVPGFLPYAAFLAWMVPSALMLEGGTLSYAMRFAQFVSFAVLALYVLNARRSLPAERLLPALTAVWVWVVLGGYLGMTLPDLELSFTVGKLLPGSLADNPYAADLFYPGVAEIQRPWGAEEPFVRPAAPFAYANGWGASIALLTPVLLATVALVGSRAGTMWALVGLVLAVPPAVATTNRGLFLTLGVVLGYAMLRLLLRGQVLVPLMVSAAAVAVALVGGWRALFASVTARQEVADTTEGRSNLYVETWERTLSSPVLGHGAPRPSFSSEINVGTQGMVWNVMFCFGLVGLVLFVYFLTGLVVRTFSVPSTAGLWLHTALVGVLFMSTFYGLDRHLPYILVVAALLLRDKGDPSSPLWRRA